MKKNFDGLAAGLSGKKKRQPAGRLAGAPVVKSVIIRARQPVLNDSAARGPVLSAKQKPAERAGVFSARTAALAGVMALLAGVFISGIWVGNTTIKTVAEEGRGNDPLSYQIPLAGLDASGFPEVEVQEALYSMPIDQLENYLQRQTKKHSINEPPADPLLERKERLRSYLSEKRSPFVTEAEVIAEQPHWKLILAISFAESTLGRHCADNNCSGIGVAPGHRLWRKYPTVADWVVDFNSLLERRYKDWTLQKMCGVYVQPCNKNWLRATAQILSELAERGID